MCGAQNEPLRSPGKTTTKPSQGHPGGLSWLSGQLDFSSSHDLLVREFESRVGLHSDGTESAWDSLSLPLSFSAPTPLSLSQK